MKIILAYTIYFIFGWSIFIGVLRIVKKSKSACFTHFSFILLVSLYIRWQKQIYSFSGNSNISYLVVSTVAVSEAEHTIDCISVLKSNLIKASDLNLLFRETWRNNWDCFIFTRCSWRQLKLVANLFSFLFWNQNKLVPHISRAYIVWRAFNELK